MHWVLFLLGAGLADAIVFEMCADPLLIDGGSRIVTHHRVSRWAAWFALGLYTAAIMWAVLDRAKAGALGTVTVLVLLMTSHGLSEDATKGLLVERVALVPVRSLAFPLADGPGPVYRSGFLWIEAETPAGRILVFRGLPPFRLSPPEGRD